MMRWSSRRARRHDIHPDTPPDLMALVRLADEHAPRLLQGQDPDRVGLVLLAPRLLQGQDPSGAGLGFYRPRIHDVSSEGGAFVRALPIEELVDFARLVNLEARHRPGWFDALFLTPKHKVWGHLAPEERTRFEESAS